MSWKKNFLCLIGCISKTVHYLTLNQVYFLFNNSYYWIMTRIEKYISIILQKRFVRDCTKFLKALALMLYDVGFRWHWLVLTYVVTCCKCLKNIGVWRLLDSCWPLVNSVLTVESQYFVVKVEIVSFSLCLVLAPSVEKGSIRDKIFTEYRKTSDNFTCVLNWL